MTEPRDFDEIYSSELKPELLSIEKNRKAVLWNGLGTFILLAVSVSGLIWFFKSESLLPVYFLILSLLILAVAAFFGVRCYYRNKTYVGAFKSVVIHALIKSADPSLRYDPFKYVSEHDYKKSGLFLHHYDRFRGDDFVEGVRDKTVFCFSEVHTEFQVNTGKSSHWENIFRGLFFIADFNKNFQGRTYVWNASNPQLNMFNKFFSSFDDGLEKISLESTEFASRFIVYSSDQVEARYILTPSMMERMIGVQDQLEKPVIFSFVDTNIYVAVPYSTDLFEPAVFSTTGKNMLKSYFDAVNRCLSLIDELHLNTRIWNKS